MGVQQFAGILVDLVNDTLGRIIIKMHRVEQAAGDVHLFFAQRERPGFGKRVHDRPDGAAIAVAQIEQQPFEITGNLDIHARADGGMNLARLHFATMEKAGQNIIAVGTDNQLLDPQAHIAGAVSGEYIAEVAGRHGKRYRRADPAGAIKIIDNLRHHPHPVD